MDKAKFGAARAVTRTSCVDLESFHYPCHSSIAQKYTCPTTGYPASTRTKSRIINVQGRLCIIRIHRRYTHQMIVDWDPEYESNHFKVENATSVSQTRPFRRALLGPRRPPPHISQLQKPYIYLHMCYPFLWAPDAERTKQVES
jgi:hypothetical protein